MANYNIVVDTSNFRPYDYSLAYRAIQDYNRGYEQSLAIYDKIAQTLGDLKSAVEGSTRAKQIYDAYQDNFNVAADEFSRGMNINTARKLGELRKIYGTLIRQLEKANEAMVKEAERRRAANPEHNMLYQNIGTLDDWMDNPNRTLGSYSGTLLSAEVSSMMKAAASDMIKLDNAGLLNPYVKKWLKTKGFSSENVNKAIAEVLQGGIDNVKDNIMRGILQSAMQSSGIYNWADEDTKRKAEIIASRGLYGGIGQSEVGTYKDELAAKQLEYDYAVKLAEKLSELKLQEALNALRNSGLGTAGGIGETLPLHFSDSKQAGTVMRNTMARATKDFFLEHKDNKYVKAIIDEWKDKGGLEAAAKHWAENGFDGSTIRSKNKDDKGTPYYALRQYLRENVTKNEDLINVWTSDYNGIVPTNTYDYYGMAPGTPSPKYTPVKDWKTFNDAATHGYTYNGIIGADDPTQLSEYLSKMLPHLTANGEIKLYDIQDIDTKGNIKYSTTPTKLADMPTKTIGGNTYIDTSGITSKVTLPDGSWLLTWNDKDGNPVQKVLRKSDRSLEYLGDLNNIDTQLQRMKEVYKDNPEMQLFLELMAIRAKEDRGYDVLRQVNVEKLKR